MPKTVRPRSAAQSPDLVMQLRNEIMTGRLQAGQRLTELELTKRFAVGRGRVREAIQQLSLQGLLITRPNCGAEVAPEAPKAIRELTIPIRRTIEVYALRSIFDELTDADFDRWEAILDQMRNACRQRDFHALAESDIAFHRAILERARQIDLLVIWETLVGRIRLHFQRIQRRCPDPMDIYAEHRELLDAFRSGDEPAAVRLLKSKIE